MRYQVRSPQLPLAIYREVAAHLRQVTGVEARLITQSSQEFDYNLSQVGSLWIEGADDLPPACWEQVEKILTHYGDRYGSWEKIDDQG